MLGNIGGSSVECKSKRVGLGYMEIDCPSGAVYDVKNAFWPWEITEYKIIIKNKTAQIIPAKP